MSWLTKRLGNGLWGTVDTENPSNPPQVSTYPVNKTVYSGEVQIDTFLNTGVMSISYAPAVASKLLCVMISVHKSAKVNFVFGTTGAQTAFAVSWQNEHSQTYIYTFPGGFPISSSQTFQVFVWNEDAAAQYVSATIMAYEPA